MKKHTKLKFIIHIACGIIAALTFASFSEDAAFGGEISHRQIKRPKPPKLYAPDLYADNDFSEFYFYEEDKLERYEAYQKQNPELSAQEVVWRVNSMLDIGFYEQVTEIRDLEAAPLLVNKYNRLPEDYVPPDLTGLPSGRLMSKDAAEAFLKLQKDARELGYTIRDVSAYRSYDYQKNLYNRYLSGDSRSSVDTYSARAGFSEHQTGMAVDLSAADGVMGNFGYTKEYKWIEENAHSYGFIVRYPKGLQHITGYRFEPWHIRYIGAEAAGEMRRLGIVSFEEYTVKYIAHRPD